MVRLSPFCLMASASVVTAHRVTANSEVETGSMERAKDIWMGPLTCPQLTPVVMTAPKVRMSKNVWHIQDFALS